MSTSDYKTTVLYRAVFTEDSRVSGHFVNSFIRGKMISQYLEL